MKISSLTVIFLAGMASVTSAAQETSLRGRNLQSGGGGGGGQGGNQPPPNGGNGGNQNGGSGGNTPAPGDLNVRFNKIEFPNIQTPNFMPLQPTDYPVLGDIAESLKHDAMAISVVTAYDPELYGGNAQSFINAIGGPPLMPNSDSNHPFWDDFRHVVDVQQTRRIGGDPSELLRLPDLWEGMNIHEVAEAVHDEYPGALQVELIQWLWQEGAQLDYDVVPFRSSFDFVGLVIRLADLNTWAIGAVAPTNFHLKWYVGRPRPEEVAYKIAEGELTANDGVPQDIISKIDLMDLDSATAFTAYDEGCPTHPSWPAMHSAASSASFWLAVALDLSEDQYCEALRVDYAVSYARTVAGVHYPTDNIAGLNLGQQIMAEQLAHHFERKYGSDRDEVQAKIDGLRFDWANFNPKTCSTGPNYHHVQDQGS
jgi:membrane-associated phospholipid phosphatase